MKHSTTRLDPKGIHFDKVIGKFVVQIKAAGKRKTMRFDTLEKAKAALAAEQKRPASEEALDRAMVRFGPALKRLADK